MLLGATSRREGGTILMARRFSKSNQNLTIHAEDYVDGDLEA